MRTPIHTSGWRYRVAYATWETAPIYWHLPARAYRALRITPDHVEVEPGFDGIEAYRQLQLFLGDLVRVARRELSRRAVSRRDHKRNPVTALLRAAE